MRVLTAPVEAATPYIAWGPVIAGAIAASALSFVLLTFGAALGLSIASPAPTWRDASVGLAFLSGVFVLLTAAVSFGVGGYLAGRLRPRGTAAGPDESEFRDGVHGLLVWALGVALGACPRGCCGGRYGRPLASGRGLAKSDVG